MLDTYVMQNNFRNSSFIFWKCNAFHVGYNQGHNEPVKHLDIIIIGAHIKN